MRLVVGLGNPGPRYSGTRHNAGFLVVDELARRHAVDLRAGRDGEEGRLGTVRLLKPGTFMNLSGAAVQAAATRSGIRPQEICVVHDDLDLPLGRVRVRVGGGAGGQKGVRDVIDRLGPDFVRVKVGIGRPPARWTVENWVLSRFRSDEAEVLEAVVGAAADAVETILREGPDAAATRVNGLDLSPGAEARDRDAAARSDGGGGDDGGDPGGDDGGDGTAR